MQMHDPPHLGRLLREEMLLALGVTVTDAAARLGVSGVSLRRFIHGRAGAPPELTLHLAWWLPEPMATVWR